MDQQLSKLICQDHKIQITQGQLFVRQWIPATLKYSVPLILLHDSLGSVAQWRDFPAQLSARLNRPVIAYDRLGFGQSSARQDRPSAAFIVEEAEIIFPALCQAMDIKRFSLLGHSVGGVMALTIAASQKDACEAAITLSAQAFVEERTRQGIRDAQQQFTQETAFSKLIKWHGDKARWVLDAWTETWLSSAFDDWTLDPYLQQVNTPVLAIHGDRDEYGSIAFPKRIAKEVIGPSTAVIMENCGHLPHAEYPEEVINLVDEFMNLRTRFN